MLLEVNTKGPNSFLHEGRGVNGVWNEGNESSAPAAAPSQQHPHFKPIILLHNPQYAQGDLKLLSGITLCLFSGTDGNQRIRKLHAKR
jgi:hypothetical protein